MYAALSRRLENPEFAKLENPLPGAKCAEIIRESEGRLQVVLGLWGSNGRRAAAWRAELWLVLESLSWARIIGLYAESGTKDSRRLLVSHFVVPVLLPAAFRGRSCAAIGEC